MNEEMDSAHDQLPSVESYKADIGFRRSDHGGGSSSKNDTVIMEADLEEDTCSFNNDLPNVDDYKAAHPSSKTSSSESGRWKVAFFVVLLVLIAMIVGITVPVTKTNKETEQSWFDDSERYFAIEQYIFKNNISSLTDLQDRSSPQHLAANWIANKDGMHLDIPPHGSRAPSSLSFIERYVLAVFYYATGGPGWTHQLNFLTDEHVCTWYGMLPKDESTTSDVDAQVITLGIHACKLVGEELVPMSLFIRTSKFTMLL